MCDVPIITKQMKKSGKVTSQSNYLVKVEKNRSTTFWAYL